MRIEGSVDSGSRVGVHELEAFAAAAPHIAVACLVTPGAAAVSSFNKQVWFHHGMRASTWSRV